jgi:predicted pyridoxine 5'-phosphate oxidase superfamily flavin-nucleotide-binding protein
MRPPTLGRIRGKLLPLSLRFEAATGIALVVLGIVVSERLRASESIDRTAKCVTINDDRTSMTGRKRIAEATTQADDRLFSGGSMTIMYHDGNRRLQDEFDSRRISDRLEEKLTRTAFTADHKAFIESAIYFFISTAAAEGRPDCSFKGGSPGFVRVTGDCELAFPDYDGNGMFKSLGNMLVNPNVGLLFIDLHERPRRLRVNGSATVSRDDPKRGQRLAASRSPGLAALAPARAAAAPTCGGGLP